MIRSDKTYYRVRSSIIALGRMAQDWDEFRRLGNDAKDAIINAVLDSRQGRPSFQVRHYEEEFVEDTESIRDDDQFLEIASQTTPVSHVLLTQEKYVEQAIQNHLQAGLHLGGISYVIDVKDKKAALTLVPLPGPQGSMATKTFIYAYEPTASGGLSDALSRLTNQIDADVRAYRDNVAIDIAPSETATPVVDPTEGAEIAS